MQVGPFQVVEEIARGGAGVVYRARDAQGRWVALKLLLEHRALNPLARARFRRETAALTRLRHPGVVSIVDAGEFEGQLWIALDFVEGETLEQRLRRGSLPIPEVLDLFQQLVQAMGYVHTCGLLHRDLKPDNVLLSGGRALLTDFGLVLDEGRDGTRVTTSGVFMGTPGYWAPEQAFGDTGAIGPTTDVYGLGGVLYACLTGRAPMTGASLEDYVQAVRFGSIVPPRQARTDVPAWLDALCMRCLERDPAARPASVEEVARALASAGSSAAGGRARVGPWAGLVLALGVAASLGVWHLARGEDEPASAPVAQPPSGPAPAEGRPAALAEVEAARAVLGAGEVERALERIDALLAREPDAAAALDLRVEALLLLGREDEAEAAAERALAAAPEDVASHLARARVAFARLQHPRTLSEAAAVLARAPQHPLALGLRAAASANLGEPDAEGNLRRALELAPESWLVWLCLARVQEAAGDWPAVVEAASRARDLQPRAAEPWRQLGYAQLMQGDSAGAVRGLSEALERDPRSAMSWHNRGLAHARLGDAEAAIRDYSRALKLLPTLAQSWLSRATARMTLGRFVEALSDCERALELDPRSSMAYANRASVLYNLQRPGALEDAERAVALDPGSALAHRVRAGLRLQAQLPGALEDAQRAVALDPGDAYAQLTLGQALLLAGQPASAPLRRATELAPRMAQAWPLLTQALLLEARFAEAVEAADRGIALSPDDASLRSQRGLGRLNLPEPDPAGALEDFDAARSLGTQLDPSLIRLRAMCLQSLGRYAEAGAEFTRVLAAEPEDASSYVRRGTCRLAQGDREGARDDARSARRLGLPPNSDPRLRAALERLPQE